MEQNSVITIILNESARILRHATVPLMVWYFAPDLGENGAFALGELLAVVGSYGAVIMWSKIQEIKAKNAARQAEWDALGPEGE